MLTLRVSVLSALAVLLPAALPAQGCGFGDDGFAAVPCCTPATATLPTFPSFLVSGRYGCLKDCALEQDFPVRVQTFHIPVLCDYAVLSLTVVPGSSTAPGFTGALLAKYARTWREPDSTGAVLRQVWRFLINGDLRPTSGAAPCPQPPHPPGLPVHFHGHLDYACEVDASGTQVFRMALSLHHLTGCIEHNFFSCNPLVGPSAHDDRSYHLVAPGAFAFNPVGVPSGVVFAEAARSATVAGGYTCFGEARLQQGGINLVQRDCLCVPPNPNATHPFVHYDHSGSFGCAGLSAGYGCLPIGVPLPPLPRGCTALGVGNWTGAPGSFPGQRELVTHWGLVRYQDPCNPSDPPFHFVQGVSTSGVPGQLFNVPGLTARVFLDLQDMRNPSSLSGGSWMPAWGCIYVSKVVFNLNL